MPIHFHNTLVSTLALSASLSLASLAQAQVPVTAVCTPLVAPVVAETVATSPAPPLVVVLAPCAPDQAVSPADGVRPDAAPGWCLRTVVTEDVLRLAVTLRELPAWGMQPQVVPHE